MKLKLDIDNLTDDFFEDSKLLGIVAPAKDYLFCWQLNQRMHFDFRLNAGLEIELHKKHRHYYFSIYEYTDIHCSLTHYLYNNQFDGEYLLPEFRHLDYLWLMKGDTVSKAYLQQLMENIKTIPAVQLVTELTLEKIKNKGHLVF